MELSESDIKSVIEMCNFIIRLQQSGNAVPGHVPRSGVFAGCSMACDPQCLSVIASRLVFKIETETKHANPKS